MEEEEFKLPQLSSEEIRVLGALMEKSKTTPDNYPMTLNGITTACNQKSSRNPVVSYDEETVVLALDGLKRKGFVSSAIGGGSRTNKYKHNFHLMFTIGDGAIATMCLLFLRGPLTSGEINSNAGRIYSFDSLDEVHQSIAELKNYEEIPLIQQLSKRPGQKEARIAHVLSGPIDESEEDFNIEEPARKSVSSLEARVEELESQLAEVSKKLEDLIFELKG